MVRTVERSLYDYDKKDGSAPEKGEGEWEDGFCSICTTARAPHICVKCKKLVCSEHFVSIMGLCVECAPVKDTGKNFKITEQPSKGKPARSIYEPTIQDIAKFDPPEDVREVVVVRSRKKRDTGFREKKEDGKKSGKVDTSSYHVADSNKQVKEKEQVDGKDRVNGKHRVKGKEITIDWV